MQRIDNPASQRAPEEIINLYKKNRAFNRLSADLDVKRKENTSLWFHPYHLDFIERLAEHRGISMNSTMVEILTWGMATGVPPTLSHGLTVGNVDECVCKRIRVPRKVQDHLRWLSYKYGETMSYIMSVYVASYMVKVQEAKQSA